MVLLRTDGVANVKEAHIRLSAAYELAAHDVRVIDGLGCVAYRLGQIELAVRYFRAAIYLDPGYDRAYAHLALIAERQGKAREASRLYRQALALNPLNHRTRNNFAMHLLDSRRLRRARFELSKARSLAPRGEPLIERNLERLP